jgi:XapX domain-containing protein
MWPYVISVLVGIFVGMIYAGLGVHSPAPPLFALFGLLGILIGENGFPVAKAKLASVFRHETLHSEFSGSTPVRPGNTEKSAKK